MRFKLIPLCILPLLLMTGCSEKTSSSTSFEYKDYSITIDKDDYINVNISKNMAKPGEEIEVSYNLLNSNYSLFTYRIYRTYDNLEINIDDNKFVMPYGDVIFEAKTTKYDEYKRQENSVFGDIKYKNGLNVYNTDNVHPSFEKDLDYCGKRETTGTGQRVSNKIAYWTYCQWWTPTSINSIQGKHIDGYYRYQDEYRDLGVNTNTGTIDLNFNTDNIYKSSYGEYILNQKNWPHMLIEQHLPFSSFSYFKENVDSGKSYYLTGDFTISMDNDGFYDDRCLARGGSLNWYIVLAYRLKDGEKAPADLCSDPNMYLGFPIYDSRYLDGIPAYDQADIGQPGATGRYVYNLPSRTYINERFKYGKKYSINLNINQYIENSYNKAKSKGFLKGTTLDRMVVSYMSYGWEVYSGRVINSKVSNIDLEIK